MKHMKLINRTKWSTRQLRKLCMAVIKHTGSHKNHRITIESKKRIYCSYHGLAWLHSNRIMMYVPPIMRRLKQARFEQGSDGERKFVEWYYETKYIEFDPIIFSQVLEHEIGHNLGLQHKDMVGCNKLNADYAKDFVVEPCLEKPKPKIDHVKLRQERAISNLKRAETRFKRAETILSKWKKKVAYYANKGASQVSLDILS